MRSQSLEYGGRALAASEVFTDEFQRRANNLRMEIRRSQPRHEDREFGGMRLWDMRDIDELEWREHLRDDRPAIADRKFTPRLKDGLLRFLSGFGG